MLEAAVKRGKEYLYFKNGKPKKSYCACLTWYPKELYRIYGVSIYARPNYHQCAGLRCPFYSVGCGKSELEKWEKQQKEV